MFGQTYGHGVIRKMVVYFGTLFNNIYVNRYDEDGNIAQTMKVPLNYGPRDKFLARLEGNPDFDRQVAIQLPRMAFEMGAIYYDPSRKLPNTSKIRGCPTETNRAPYTYAPVPYNIEFSLYIMVKNIEDGTFIVEQILPYFAPDWTATLILNNDLNLKYDVPVALEGVSSEDTYAGDFVTRRAIIWTLKFTMKTWFFGPTRGDGKPIYNIDVDIIDEGNGAEKFNVTPGLNANSEPVHWYGNPESPLRPSSMSANTILPDSNYGFMVDIRSEN